MNIPRVLLPAAVCDFPVVLGQLLGKSSCTAVRKSLDTFYDSGCEICSRFTSYLQGELSKF